MRKQITFYKVKFIIIKEFKNNNLNILLLNNYSINHLCASHSLSTFTSTHYKNS